jgi:hypothetical protein
MHGWQEQRHQIWVGAEMKDLEKRRDKLESIAGEGAEHDAILPADFTGKLRSARHLRRHSASAPWNRVRAIECKSLLLGFSRL